MPNNYFYIEKTEPNIYPRFDIYMLDGNKAIKLAVSEVEDHAALIVKALNSPPLGTPVGSTETPVGNEGPVSPSPVGSTGSYCDSCGFLWK